MLIMVQKSLCFNLQEILGSQNGLCVQGTIVGIYLFLSQAYVCVWFIYFANINHQAKNKVTHRDLFAWTHDVQDRPTNPPISNTGVI